MLLTPGVLVGTTAVKRKAITHFILPNWIALEEIKNTLTFSTPLNCSFLPPSLEPLSSKFPFFLSFCPLCESKHLLLDQTPLFSLLHLSANMSFYMGDGINLRVEQKTQALSLRCLSRGCCWQSLETVLAGHVQEDSGQKPKTAELRELAIAIKIIAVLVANRNGHEVWSPLPSPSWLTFFGMSLGFSFSGDMPIRAGGWAVLTRLLKQTTTCQLCRENPHSTSLSEWSVAWGGGEGQPKLPSRVTKHFMPIFSG